MWCRIFPWHLDTSNIDAIEAALKVIKQVPDGTPHIVNSIMCRPERYERMVPMTAEYNADFVALMWGPEGLPRDENERAALCVELLYFANEAGIPNEKIWVDGIVTPVNIQQPQAISLMEFQKMIPDMAPGARAPADSPISPTDRQITCAPSSTRPIWSC
jgi:5-methyltetrahydrofolate corrinoid/iron sulfur protein methyltransferase